MPKFNVWVIEDGERGDMEEWEYDMDADTLAEWIMDMVYDASGVEVDVEIEEVK